jgi:hypothetical protein
VTNENLAALFQDAVRLAEQALENQRLSTGAIAAVLSRSSHAAVSVM